VIGPDKKEAKALEVPVALARPFVQITVGSPPLGAWFSGVGEAYQSGGGERSAERNYGDTILDYGGPVSDLAVDGRGVGGESEGQQCERGGPCIHPTPRDQAKK
jgi:hypothetical protein